MNENIGSSFATGILTGKTIAIYPAISFGSSLKSSIISSLFTSYPPTGSIPNIHSGKKIEQR